MSTSKVTLLPGGHQFTVQGEETVLEAALRAGVSVSYGCSNGNCGDCRARVLSGEVRKVRPHDYVFSETQKQQGYALMCSVTADSDLSLEMLVAEGPAQIPWQQITASVRGLERPNPNLLILRVQTPRTRRLRFLAGQSVRLSLDGGALTASLALANCPCDDRNLVFHVQSDESDPFARYCFERMRSGEPVEVEGPFGDLTLTDETPRPLLFLAWGNGFAPIRSLVEHVLAQESAEVLDLLWLSDSVTGHYQDNLCRSWQDAMDNLHYRALTLPEGFDAPGVGTELSQALKNVIGIQERHAFVAGPREFVARARDVLMTLGVDPQHCRIQPIPPQQDG